MKIERHAVARRGRERGRGAKRTSLERLEKKVLKVPGAAERIAKIEEELRLAVALTGLRERAGLSQRELADRMGVSQPRIAAIERCHNVTIDVLKQYVAATGGALEVSVVSGGKKSALIPARPRPVTRLSRSRRPVTKAARSVRRATKSAARKAG